MLLFYAVPLSFFVGIIFVVLYQMTKQTAIVAPNTETLAARLSLMVERGDASVMLCYEPPGRSDLRCGVQAWLSEASFVLETIGYMVRRSEVVAFLEARGFIWVDSPSTVRNAFLDLVDDEAAFHADKRGTVYVGTAHAPDATAALMMEMMSAFFGMEDDRRLTLWG